MARGGVVPPAGARLARDDGPLLPELRLAARSAARRSTRCTRFKAARAADLGPRRRAAAQGSRGGRATSPERRATDRFAAARAVADAVLYEGYVLYPYRASAPKNQVRWQFGVLVPPASPMPTTSERAVGCAPSASSTPALIRRSRCACVASRCSAARSSATAAGGGHSSAVTSAGRRRRTVVPWDEAVEHELDLVAIAAASRSTARRRTIPVRAARRRGRRGAARPPTATSSGGGPATASRSTAPCASRPSGPTDAVRCSKVSSTVENITDWAEPDAPPRRADAPLARRRAHAARDRRRRVRLAARSGRRRRAKPSTGCTSDGTFPVLDRRRRAA